MARKSYPSDLNDTEWEMVGLLVPQLKKGGRPGKWERREILDAILYQKQNGGVWRMLPHDFPPWKSVYHYYRLWNRDGSLESISSCLQSKWSKERGAGRRDHETHVEHPFMSREQALER